MYEGYHLLGHYLYTASVDSTLFNYVSPEKSVASMDIHGPFGDIYIDVNGQRIAGYEVKRVSKAQVSSNYLIDLGTVTTSKKCSRLACLHYELNSTVSFEPPKDVPLCGFHGEICDQTGVIYAIVVVIAIACVFVLLCSGIRSVLVTGKGRSISNPWLIPFYDLRFIDLSNTDGIFQMRSNIQHDNLNGFIGLAFDRASHIYVIWTQCFRGSLHDHIFTSKSKRETATNFEGAFLRDILKGLEYLHTISALEYHGSLTLFNCMLDSHWIVKLSGFGMDRLLIKWKAGGQIFTEDHTPLIRSEELHYYDPALKKIWRQFTGTKADKQLINAEFGRKCDMYGFGVCLYEIYFKKKFVPILFDTPSESEDESLLLDDANDEIASKYPLPIVIPDGVFMHNDLLRTLENCFGNNRPDIKLVRKVIDTVLKMQGSLVDLMIKNLTSYTVGLTKTVEIRTVQLQVEQRKSDALLAELIPSSIARELQTGFRIEPKIYPNATILYSDIVGFTSLCSQSSPMEVVTLLSGMYQRFDLIISQQGGYKMETIGDAYCVAAGLPIPTEHEHVKMICMIALLQRECLHQFEIPHRPGQYLNCRWGFNSGEVFAGIIGVKAPRYACFGEAATLASKMESNGMEDRIQMTLSSKQIIEEHYSEFTTSSRGGTSIEGYGFLITYWLEGLETSAASRVSEFQKSMYQMLEEIAKEPQSAFAWSSSERRDKMAMARERLMAERRMMAERLQRQQTIQEALEEHEEEVEMNVVLKDEDAKNDSVDLASIISTQPDDDDEEENEIVAGRGRTIDSQASTIPEN
uniref:guanylate cyclase n=1 Tax=Caenorhabditis tropicalis TaxID=1561998 RepID=A0A1I7T5F9_9PELO